MRSIIKATNATMRNFIKTIIPGKIEALLIVVMCVAFFVFATRSMHRYESLHAYYFDLGIMHQVVANTAHGHFLEMTDPNYYFQGNRLGYHFDFILALFAPFYLLFNDARVLLMGQSLIIVLGALPLFLLAKGHLKNKIAALAIATLYLLYFPVHATIIADFHAVALSTSFILWMWYAIEKGRYKLAMLMIVLSWMTKENVPLVTGAIGFYFYFNGHKKFGGALFECWNQATCPTPSSSSSSVVASSSADSSSEAASSEASSSSAASSEGMMAPSSSSSSVPALASSDSSDGGGPVNSSISSSITVQSSSSSSSLSPNSSSNSSSSSSVTIIVLSSSSSISSSIASVQSSSHSSSVPQITFSSSSSSRS
jgi:hypothetical protein